MPGKELAVNHALFHNPITLNSDILYDFIFSMFFFTLSVFFAKAISILSLEHVHDWLLNFSTFHAEKHTHRDRLGKQCEWSVNRCDSDRSNMRITIKLLIDFCVFLPHANIS